MDSGWLEGAVATQTGRGCFDISRPAEAVVVRTLCQLETLAAHHTRHRSRRVVSHPIDRTKDSSAQSVRLMSREFCSRKDRPTLIPDQSFRSI